MGRPATAGRLSQAGTVQASGLIRTLQTKDRPTRLARALEEVGRLVKTLYLLRYIEDEAYRLRYRRRRAAFPPISPPRAKKGVKGLFGLARRPDTIPSAPITAGAPGSPPRSQPTEPHQYARLMSQIPVVTAVGPGPRLPKRLLRTSEVPISVFLFGSLLSKNSQYTANCFGGIRIRWQSMPWVHVVLKVLC